jgi:hypothetical protein
MTTIRSSRSFLAVLSVLPVLFCGTTTLSCAGSTADSESGAELTILINAPSPAATYYSNEGVPFEVIARVDGSPTDITHASWSLDNGAQEHDGASGTFSPMSAGEHTAHVEALVNGQTGSRDVTFTVLVPEADADTDADTDADADADADVIYTGVVAATIDYSGSYGDFGSDCPGTIQFTVTPGGVMAGDGNCNASGYDFPFTVEGSATAGDVSGTLVMTSDGTEARTPFTGRGAVGNPMNASYDATHRSGGDSVHIYGTWTASPQ